MVWQHQDRWIFQVTCRTAQQVYVVGDFNNWSTRTDPMRRAGDGQWELTLRLRPGEYRFRYLTDDGRWLTDYAAFGVIRNQQGGWDSVLYVPPASVTELSEQTITA